MYESNKADGAEIILMKYGTATTLKFDKFNFYSIQQTFFQEADG
jgi:hypothetical protein